MARSIMAIGNSRGMLISSMVGCGSTIFPLRWPALRRRRAASSQTVWQEQSLWYRGTWVTTTPEAPAEWTEPGNRPPGPRRLPARSYRDQATEWRLEVRERASAPIQQKAKLLSHHPPAQPEQVRGLRDSGLHRPPAPASGLIQPDAVLRTPEPCDP